MKNKKKLDKELYSSITRESRTASLNNNQISEAMKSNISPQTIKNIKTGVKGGQQPSSRQRSRRAESRRSYIETPGDVSGG